MTAVTYLAKRSLISGHSVGAEYSLNLKCTDINPRRTVSRTVKVPLAGVGAEVTRNYAYIEYAVVLAPLAGGTPLASITEFLDSCEDQSFTFDPYGSIATPGTSPAPFVARLKGDGYALERVLKRRQGGGNDYFRISFEVLPA